MLIQGLKQEKTIGNHQSGIYGHVIEKAVDQRHRIAWVGYIAISHNISVKTKWVKGWRNQDNRV